MSRRIILLIIVMMTGAALFAEAKPGVHKHSWGLSFQIQGLTAPLANANDGVIGGVGVRHWLLEEFVLRGIFFFDLLYSNATAVSTIRSGLSLGAEYHFVKGGVSPYAGAMAGLEAWTNPNGIDWHVGALVGVELTPLEFLAFFIEYSLRVTFRQTGTEVNLGYNNAPIFGLIIYFN